VLLVGWLRMLKLDRRGGIAEIRQHLVVTAAAS
jgi:hypothetical protein